MTQCSTQTLRVRSTQSVTCLEAEIRKNYQYFISFRNTRKCRTSQLQRQQGRSYRTHKGCSQRACQPGNHSKRSGTGLCRDRDDRCACRCGKGESFITDSAWQTGKHKGYRKRSIIFSIRCSRLHHRPGAVC